MDNIFSKAYEGLKNKLPVLRRPSSNSAYNDLLIDYSWVLSNRNKSAGVGWQTYYAAGRNVWLRSCINVYINEVRNLGFEIKSPDESHQNVERVGYLTDLFNNPMGNYSQDTYATYQSAMWHSLLLLGDAFSEVIYDPEYTSVPVGFKHIPTELMYYYEDTDQWGFINNGYRFEAEELIHVKEPGIRGSVWGESPVDVLAKDLTLDILGRNFTKEILERKGLDPSGVIEYSSDLNDAAYNSEITRLQAMANSNRRGTMILRGAKFNKVGITQEDMEYSKLSADIRDRILAVMGVPPAKVSIIETASIDLGSGQTQDKQFKKTFAGKAKLFEDAFNKVLGRSAFLEYFKYNELDIEDRLVKAQIDDIRLGNGTSTINEIRASYGQPPLLDSDYGFEKRLNNYKNVLHREGVLDYQKLKYERQ